MTDQNTIKTEFKEMMEEGLLDMGTHDFYLKAIRILMNKPEYKALIASIEEPEAVDKADGWGEWICGAYLSECPIDRDTMIQTRLTSWNKEQIFTGLAGESTWHSGWELAHSVYEYRIKEPIVKEKKPEKQTLLQFMDVKYKNNPDFDRRFYTQCLSEYLEREDS